MRAVPGRRVREIIGTYAEGGDRVDAAHCDASPLFRPAWTTNPAPPDNEIVPQPWWPKVAGLWYLCIALGFLLLGIRAMMAGAPTWTIILRWLVAAGFFVLAFLEQRERKR